MKTLRYILFAIFVVVFIVWAMLYQAGMISGGKKVEPGERTLAAKTETGEWQVLAEREIDSYYRAVGSIRSREEIDIVSRLPSARVVEIPYRAGESFEAGALLIRMESADLQAQVDAVTENLKGAESRLEFATTEYERFRKLKDANAVSLRDYDTIANAYNTAQAQVAVLRQELLYAQTNLQYSEIKAPFSGMVSERRCEPGDLATPQNVLLRIFNPAKLQFRVPLREGLYAAVKIGDVLHAEVEATGDKYAAQVREIIPEVSTLSRSFLINACLEKKAAGLMPGMFAVCNIPLGKRRVLTLPAEAVQKIGQLKYVTLKGKDGEQLRQLVKTGTLPDGQVELISGAKAGDSFLWNEPK
ncbi:MAG: efflux RND transporter periplasmic adaptor subunit [Lentisphaerae bacterium]|nr:efflux RND transporter periplasmic adaptor subunit [Lentisphaerota bacterium]OQC17550.1 MAG: Multidrug resistance protein MdtE precursor [Lentisphaerae bacterium ADurb.Bin082]HQL87341.1 efflux RND transporter periplasmic adaptor subunit [Lentisphaeria bacterium]